MTLRPRKANPLNEEIEGLVRPITKDIVTTEYKK